MSAKQALREAVFSARDSMSASQRASDSASACARLLSVLRDRQSSLSPPRPLAVASFVSFRSEIDTTACNEALLREPATFALALPRVVAASSANTRGQLSFFFVRSMSESTMQRSRFGILEPRVDANTPALASQIDVVVTPGVAFDARGGRLGYGAGFYDSFLRGIAASDQKTIAFAFDQQIVPHVPLEPHDMLVGQIVTPTRCLNVKEER
jgi:5-formyltetrahydrofolate cyclo-ligase